MLQLFNKVLRKQEVTGNFNDEELWSEAAEVVYKKISFRHLTFGKTDDWEAFEPIFPGLGHLYAPLWKDLETKILPILKLSDGRGTLFHALMLTSGRMVYIPFLRSYHQVGAKITNGVYFSEKGAMKLTEFMLLKASKKVPDEILAEWSGIPVSRLDEVYDGGATYVKSIIESVAREELGKKKGHTVIFYPRLETRPEKMTVKPSEWTPIEE